MKLKKAIKILENHNKWRRDKNVPSKIKAQDPVEIGKAIDYALTKLKKLRVADVIKNEVAVCDVCGSDDITEAPHMGKNCNSCNPL